MILWILIFGWAIYGGPIPLGENTELRGKQARIFAL